MRLTSSPLALARILLVASLITSGSLAVSVRPANGFVHSQAIACIPQQVTVVSGRAGHLSMGVS